MSLFTYIKPKGAFGFGYASTAEDVTAGLSLVGKTFLVTAAIRGLDLSRCGSCCCTALRSLRRPER